MKQRIVVEINLKPGQQPYGPKEGRADQPEGYAALQHFFADINYDATITFGPAESVGI